MRRNHPPTIESCQRPLAVIVCRHVEDEGGGEGGLVVVFGDNHDRVAFVLADHLLPRRYNGSVVVYVLHYDDDCSCARLRAFSEATSTFTSVIKELAAGNKPHPLHERQNSQSLKLNGTNEGVFKLLKDQKRNPDTHCCHYSSQCS